MNFNKITDLEISQKRLFIRLDLNVPLDNGIINDDTRIIASLPTIKYALKHGAKIIIATHLGRPSEGTLREQDSVKPVAIRLAELLQYPVLLCDDFDIDFESSNVVMLENVRCNDGEASNSPILGAKYASLCDIFVHDAFAAAHRAEASTDAIADFAPQVCAGLLMISELESLAKALHKPKHPVVAIVGGSKVSTKLSILENLASKVDYLIVGGGILNTFMLANGSNIGKSLAEIDLVDKARQIIKIMQDNNSEIPLPQDVVVSDTFSSEAKATTKDIANVAENEMILDVGSQFANQLSQIISSAGTIIWNGPLGVFEFDQFANGTKVLATAIAKSNAFSLAGGGDTIAAINKFGLASQISYISTAGGALLEFLEGKNLPAITMLEKHAK